MLFLFVSFFASFRGRYCGCLFCLSTLGPGMFASPSKSFPNLSGHSAHPKIVWQAKLEYRRSVSNTVYVLHAREIFSHFHRDPNRLQLEVD